MHSRHLEEADHAGHETIEPPVSISYFFHVLKAYRGVILLSLAAIGIAFGIVALIWYLGAPSQRVTSIIFRLEFKGAADGKYPNGTKFSTNDIIDTPILLKVYDQNALREYVTFPTFARGVFIVESNREYERLQVEYQARLNDVKLTAIDRERIEREFDAKREAISKSDYAIKYLAADGGGEIPETVLHKALSDILREWSDYAAKTQRALLYDVAVLSPRFVDVPMTEAANHLATLQVLRAKVTQVRQNLSQIGQLPGVQLVRTRDNTSLEEIKLQLDDLLRFRIEPQLMAIRANGLINNEAMAIQYLESQLAHDERRLQAAERKADAIREALATYTRTGASAATPATPTEYTATQPEPRSNGNDVVMPQLSDSFLDRLVQMSNLGADQVYRQRLTEDLRGAATDMIPLREAVEFDRQLLEALRQGPARSASSTGAEVAAAIEGAKSQLRELITRMNEVYVTVSRNLNPASDLYTVLGPPGTEIARAISLKRLALYGAVVFLFSLPLIALGCLIHNRIREEEDAEMHHASKEYAPASEAAAIR